MKRIIVIAATMLLLGANAFAQDEVKGWNYVF